MQTVALMYASECFHGSSGFEFISQLLESKHAYGNIKWRISVPKITDIE